MSVTMSLNGEIRRARDTEQSKVVGTFLVSSKSDESGCAEVAIPSGTTDMEVSFPGIDLGSFILLQTDQTITLKIHPSTGGPFLPGDLTPLNITKFFVQFGAFTKLYISNASGNIANVKLSVLGAVVS